MQAVKGLGHQICHQTPLFQIPGCGGAHGSQPPTCQSSQILATFQQPVQQHLCRLLAGKQQPTRPVQRLKEGVQGGIFFQGTSLDHRQVHHLCALLSQQRRQPPGMGGGAGHQHRTAKERPSHEPVKLLRQAADFSHCNDGGRMDAGFLCPTRQATYVRYHLALIGTGAVFYHGCRCLRGHSSCQQSGHQLRKR